MPRQGHGITPTTPHAQTKGQHRDEIFQNHEDITTLESAYDSLIQDGFSEDGAAEQIAKLVFEETGVDPDYGLDEEE